MIKQSVVGESVEMYLKFIYELELINSPVTITRLAKHMAVSSPATVEMVKLTMICQSSDCYLKLSVYINHLYNQRIF